jgi:hypothetical protein
VILSVPFVSQRRQTVAACLLVASILLPLALLCVPLLDPSHLADSPIVRFSQSTWLWVLSGVQFAITPVGNVASLILGDRRKLWMKLHYVVLAVWLLVVFAFLALPWVLSHHVG